MAWVNQTSGLVWEIGDRSKPPLVGNQTNDWIWYDDIFGARHAGKAIEERVRKEKKAKQQPLSKGAGSSSSFLGILIVGLFKLCLLPFKCIFWLLKAIFFTFPKFLWKKGIVGRIILGIIILFFVIAYLVGRNM